MQDVEAETSDPGRTDTIQICRDEAGKVKAHLELKPIWQVTRWARKASIGTLSVK